MLLTLTMSYNKQAKIVTHFYHYHNYQKQQYHQQLFTHQNPLN